MGARPAIAGGSVASDPPPVGELEGGEDEGGRLAGARLGAAEDVTAGEGDGDSLCLDGGRFGVAEAGYSLEEAWLQAQIGETHMLFGSLPCSLWRAPRS